MLCAYQIIFACQDGVHVAHGHLDEKFFFLWVVCVPHNRIDIQGPSLLAYLRDRLPDFVRACVRREDGFPKVVIYSFNKRLKMKFVFESCNQATN